jgi:conflict system pore-forming effector with SLATT domain
MSPHDDQQFYRLYQIYRYEDQFNFYKARRVEFTKAQSRAIAISIGLILLAALAGGLESIDVPWLKLTCMLVAAISPLLSTALAAYSVLYAFEQQAKLYQDTGYNLLLAQVLAPDVKQGLSGDDFTKQLDKYVHEIENIFMVEQGQWGQLAKKMKPPEV